jgi:hypothetical protein
LGPFRVTSSETENWAYHAHHYAEEYGKKSVVAVASRSYPMVCLFLQHGSYPTGGMIMPAVHDTEVQRQLLNEMIEINERKRKLETALAALDARNRLLIETAARKDIEVYKDRHTVADVANDGYTNKFEIEGKKQ